MPGPNVSKAQREQARRLAAYSAAGALLFLREASWGGILKTAWATKRAPEAEFDRRVAAVMRQGQA